MLDFHAARVAAAVSGAPLFAAEGLRGTYYVSPDGYETPEVFIVLDGAAEDLRDGDEDYVAYDKPATIVFKRSGDVAYMAPMEIRGLVASATECHDPDPTPLP
ncbi:hypothetical protein SEA_ALTADENA_5 [Arthrobacter phage Altadena]|uniref:Uncharacterized protein n=1 Tax=Arthrobacter phage Altadena TaxID=3059064 RepID=A0AA96HTK8_9CAUD|nr:hypothetical protein SEA_ALTADENA_5 [Arthrobacter phage Altadena]